MSLDRWDRPSKPSPASARAARPPLTPRVATAESNASTRSLPLRQTAAAKSASATLSTKGSVNVLANGNVTPRSSARLSRVGLANESPSQDEVTPVGARSKSEVTVRGVATQDRAGSLGGASFHIDAQKKPRENRPNGLLSKGRAWTESPSVVSPSSYAPRQSSPERSHDDRFFHASDGPKQTTVPITIAPSRAQFVHANGQAEEKKEPATSPPSSVLSAVSEKRSPAPWTRLNGGSNGPTSPPLRSPGLSILSGNSPLFTPAAVQASRQKSPSPSRDNLHLSYRKGVSQVIGTRPSPRSPAPNVTTLSLATIADRRESVESSPVRDAAHRKSTSLSSVDSPHAHEARRRSTLTTEAETAPSPLVHELKASSIPPESDPAVQLPSIDTALGSPSITAPPVQSALSPTKSVADLASDARRERKVLDLEISNSSLMAINASLEREMRRQKAELKRFRRLTRAGRFSFAPSRSSEGMASLDEEEEHNDFFGFPSGYTDQQDDYSDDEESLASSAEPLSPSTHSRRESDRLARDTRRLQVDLAKHKELLVQSQAMNQSLKRCMLATEDMVSEGKKALEYQVRVSDIELGGRVLSQHEDDEEGSATEITDAALHDDDLSQAKGFLDVWASGGRPSYESSEGYDRDSGIEVDRGGGG